MPLNSLALFGGIRWLRIEGFSSDCKYLVTNNFSLQTCTPQKDHTQSTETVGKQKAKTPGTTKTRQASRSDLFYAVIFIHFVLWVRSEKSLERSSSSEKGNCWGVCVHWLPAVTGPDQARRGASPQASENPVALESRAVGQVCAPCVLCSEGGGRERGRWTDVSPFP